MSGISSSTSTALAWTLVAVGGVTWLVAVVLGLARPGTGDPLALADIVWAASFGGFLAVGGVIASRHPRNPVGWCFVLGVTAIAAGVAAGEYVTVPSRPGIGWVAAVGTLLFTVGLTVLTGVWMTLFPNGRPPSPRWRWLVPALLVTGGVLGVGQALLPSRGNDGALVPPPSPIAAAEPVGRLVVQVAGPALAVLVLLSLGSLLARYRRAGPDGRAQLRWLLWVTLLVLLLIAASAAAERVLGVGSVAGEIGGYLAGVTATVGLSAAVAVAITRYRLYDIDRLVSRTVAYAALTVLLLGTYATAVLLLEVAVRPWIGPNLDVVVATSTLVVAAAFHPLRRRVQASVDRRFNRRRADAGATLEAFARGLRDQLELATVLGDLRDAVGRAVAPTRVGVMMVTPRNAAGTPDLVDLTETKGVRP
jgi:hypothetical protein